MSEEKLYTLRYVTHIKFDALWKEGHMSRKKAYEWLAKELKIKMNQCHISMFDEELCKQTMILINKKIGKRRKVKNGRKTLQEQSTLS